MHCFIIGTAGFNLGRGYSSTGWRRKANQRVLMHADQRSKFTSMRWASFPKLYNLVQLIRRRGNCNDNAVAGGPSMFSSVIGELKCSRFRGASTSETEYYRPLIMASSKQHSSRARAIR